LIYLSVIRSPSRYLPYGYCICNAYWILSIIIVESLIWHLYTPGQARQADECVRIRKSIHLISFFRLTFECLHLNRSGPSLRVPPPTAPGSPLSIIVLALLPATRRAGGPAEKPQERAGLPDRRSWTEAGGARPESG